MRIQLIGSGGREHALAWKLAQEAEVIAAPGNPGIAEIAECRPVSAIDLAAQTDLAVELQPDLIVVGPEAPLIAGLGDRLRALDFAVLGPNADAAELEGSKAFAKAAMAEAGIPTPDFRTFHAPEPALSYAQAAYQAGNKLAVKASGPALGKGVVVTQTLEEAESAIRAMMVDRQFGDAGQTLVLEEVLPGPEFSLLTLISEDSYLSLPVAQDYKRVLSGDQGPNTGGMGSYSPVPRITPEIIRDTERAVVEPLMAWLKARNLLFRGVLFAGMMMAADGTAKCLEFNVRFGDPETQSVLRLLDKGFAEALLATALGQPIPTLPTRPGAAVSVVLASEGYPDEPILGREVVIHGRPEGVEIFHAGTKRAPDGRLISSGGRVLAVSAVAANHDQARDLAYQGIAQIELEGGHFRADIAASANPGASLPS